MALIDYLHKKKKKININRLFGFDSNGGWFLPSLANAPNYIYFSY